MSERKEHVQTLRRGARMHGVQQVPDNAAKAPLILLKKQVAAQPLLLGGSLGSPRLLFSNINRRRGGEQK